MDDEWKRERTEGESGCLQYNDSENICISVSSDADICDEEIMQRTEECLLEQNPDSDSELTEAAST